ncbi:hypothetical protein ACFX13_035309 [Malus domestica]
MVSSFSNLGFPPMHTHPPTFCAMVAANKDSLRKTLDALFAPYLAKIRHARELALNAEGDSTLTPMFAISNGGVSDPTPTISNDMKSINLDHPGLQGDDNPLRLLSPIEVHSIPPLFSSSPVLREIAAPSIKPQSNSKASMAAHTNNSKPFLSNQEAPTSVQGLGLTLSNERAKALGPFQWLLHDASDNINIKGYGDHRSVKLQILRLCK